MPIYAMPTLRAMPASTPAGRHLCHPGRLRKTVVVLEQAGGVAESRFLVIATGVEGLVPGEQRIARRTSSQQRLPRIKKRRRTQACAGILLVTGRQ